MRVPEVRHCCSSACGRQLGWKACRSRRRGDARGSSVPRGQSHGAFSSTSTCTPHRCLLSQRRTCGSARLSIELQATIVAVVVRDPERVVRAGRTQWNRASCRRRGDLVPLAPEQLARAAATLVAHILRLGVQVFFFSQHADCPVLPSVPKPSSHGARSGLAGEYVRRHRARNSCLSRTFPPDRCSGRNPAGWRAGTCPWGTESA